VTTPEPPYRGGEFPPLEQSTPQRDPNGPIDYPTNYPPLPPPVYPYGSYPTPYPGYQPYDPYGAGKPLGTNGKAIASLVTSLAGFVCCGISSVVGLILGIIAMRECKSTGQDGYGLALAGTIVGGLVTAFYVLYVALMIGVSASGFQWAP
jgi:uncharacterized protein DUF4190